MLFSNAAIASYINDNFEPVWESVRAVPIVHVDLGGDVSVTRTLHGNIATYVCNAEGNVLDVLPGAYNADTYLTQLQQLNSLGTRLVDAEEPLEQLREFHAGQLAMGIEEARLGLARTRPPARSEQAPQRIADFSKVAIIEQPIEAVLAGEPNLHKSDAMRNRSDVSNATLESLVQDTSYNELHRRRQIHEHLAQANWTAPRSLTKWLYREVLNTDLDDPYLGMKELLFSNYPFTEDAH